MAEPGSLARSADTDFLANGGEMAELVRLKDWSLTPLGPIGQWPQSLRTTVSLCLASNFPINIIWGPSHTQIYNDGYRALCGEGHPAFLGMSYVVSWVSAWPAIGEPFARALDGKASFLENQRMFLHRNGFLEETFFTFSLSPIRDEIGGICGLFHPVTETTISMLCERRSCALRDLTARLGGVRTTREVFGLAADVLAGFAFDLPFVLLYCLDSPDDEPPRYTLSAQTGLDVGTAASPWPIEDLVHLESAILLPYVAGRLGPGPCGPYEEPPESVLAVPVRLPGSKSPAAFMIAGASARLPLNDAYLGFYGLIAAAFGAALVNAQAHENECRRAETLTVLDHAKTAFLADVSHEFRTSLTLLLGPIEDMVAAAESLPASQRQRLGMAHRNALRLLRLVNSLLDFFRIEAGRFEASFKPLDLADLTAELASNFRSACERAGLYLVVDCPPLDRPIDVDRDLWEKIVLNLISNAFNFTLKGGIIVSLRSFGGSAELVVHDTGVGISAVELPRIFDRFHRVGGHQGRTHEGTGIGLALVKELVKLHGGTIAATSTYEKGTEFRVTIPFATGGTTRDHARDGQISASAGTRAKIYVEETLSWLPNQDPDQDRQNPGHASDAASRPRIIFADDNADMRAYVTSILESCGYDVEAVEDGSAALAAARRGPPPDLVLTDVMMPGLDGFALLGALRAKPGMEGVLIFLLSARAGEEARIEGLVAGADDYLVKPFSARELRARVESGLRLARQRREAAAREHELRGKIGTERNRAALLESEYRLDFALTAGNLGSWELNLTTHRFVASEICRDIFGLTLSDRLESRDDLQLLVHPDDRERELAALIRAIQTRTIFDFECRIIRPDAEIIWVQARGHAAYAKDGTPLSMIGVVLDVTERKKHEARQLRLLDELNHRVKNTLAIVQSIAMQTQRNARSPDDFRKDLSDRIAALARAHDLLTRASWDGAFLNDVIDQTLAPYSTDMSGMRQVELGGPRVRLGANAAVTLNMAFHELATNAVKYGALSAPHGKVQLRWRTVRTDGGVELEIVWRETHGPAVEAPGERGFGLRLIEKGLPSEFGGEVHVDFRPEGLFCRMLFPVSSKIRLLDS